MILNQNVIERVRFAAQIYMSSDGNNSLHEPLPMPILSDEFCGIIKGVILGCQPMDTLKVVNELSDIFLIECGFGKKFLSKNRNTVNFSGDYSANSFRYHISCAALTYGELAANSVNYVTMTEDVVQKQLGLSYLAPFVDDSFKLMLKKGLTLDTYNELVLSELCLDYLEHYAHWYRESVLQEWHDELSGLTDW